MAQTNPYIIKQSFFLVLATEQPDDIYCHQLIITKSYTDPNRS